MQKRYHVDYDYELLARWKFENADIIENQWADKKMNICVTSFTKYRLHYIEQTEALT